MLPRTALLSLLVIALTFSVFLATGFSNVKAQGGGGPFPGPCPVNSTPPPNSAPCLSIFPDTSTIASPGGTITLKVNFTNFSTFSAWDLLIKTNDTILDPQSIAIVETFSGTASTFSSCIDGGITGFKTGCTSNDGPGIAHSALGSLGGNDAGNGTLFTITYKVLAGPATNVTYVNGMSEKSTVSAPDGSSILDCLATPNQCLTGSVAVVDFTVSASPSTVGPVVKGAMATSTITVTPENGFTGTVGLLATPPPMNPAVTANLQTPSVTITSGAQTDVLTVSSSSDGSFNITVTSSITGFLTRSAIVTLIVGKLPSHTDTTVVLSSGAPLPSPLPLGSSVNDTARVTGSTNPVPSGSVVYSFFNSSVCSSPPVSTETVTLTSSGTVPHSNSTGPLAAGAYGFQATYNGDVNFTASTGPCESFSVARASSTTASTVVLKSGAALPALVPAGSLIKGTATVTGISGFNPAGTLVYRFFKNGACAAPTFFSQNVTLSGGIVPDSISTAPTTAGSYSFNATYSGDSNYTGSKGPCQVFSVDDFAVTASPLSVGTLASGVSGSSIVTFSSLNGFTGTVNLVVVPSSGLSGSLNMSAIVLTSTVTSKNVLLVVNGTLGADYSAIVNGTSSGFPFHTVLVSVTVLKPNVAAGTLSISSTSVTVGDKVTVTVTLTDNSAGVPFTTPVWLKWGDLTVAQQNVTLTPGQSTQVSLVWDTSGYTSGTNALSVNVPASGTVATGQDVTLSSTGSSFFSLGNTTFLALIIVVVAAVVIAAVFLLRRTRTGKQASTAQS